MRLPAGNNYIVEFDRVPGGGTSWYVKVYRKSLFFRKLLSSDWFLNEHQALRFAKQLAEELRNGKSLDSLTNRPPGWTLHRPG